MHKLCKHLTDVMLLPGRKYTAKAASLCLLNSSPFQQQHQPQHSLASSPVQPTSAGFAIKSIRVFPLPIILDSLIPGVDDALPQLITSFQPTNPTVPSPVASLRPLGHLFAVTSPLAIVENSCSNPNGCDSPRIMTPDPSQPTTGRQASSPNVPLRTRPPLKHR